MEDVINDVETEGLESTGLADSVWFDQNQGDLAQMWECEERGVVGQKEAPYKSLFPGVQLPEDFLPLPTLSKCEEERPEWLIDGVLMKNSYTVLNGEKNSLKSWCGAEMAVCIAEGMPFFRKEVKKGKVVYVYGEGAMKKRLKRVCKGKGIEESENIIPYPLRGDLTDEELQIDVKRHIPEGTVLVIIDNHEKFWSSDMEDKIVHSCMSFIREMREMTAVILIQHNAKRANDNNPHTRSRGSGKIMGGADSTISLTRKGDVVTAELYCREGELMENINFKLVKTEDENFYLEQLGGTDWGHVEENCFLKVVDILRVEMNEPITKTQIYEQKLKGRGIKGLSTENFYAISRELENKGHLVKQGNKYMFQLPEASKTSEK